MFNGVISFVDIEAKSAVIRRMQNNLESWEQQLKEICDKKAKNGEHRSLDLPCTELGLLVSAVQTPCK